MPCVNHLLGGARGNITRHQVAKAGVAFLQVIPAFAVRYLTRRSRVALLPWHPDSTVVAQRFAHQSQLGLVLARRWNTGGMDLGKARVGKKGPSFITAPC